MTDAEPAKPQHDTGRAVSPAAYSDFIAQIRLERIWLLSAKVENRAGPDTPEHASLQIQDSTRWEPRERGFRAVTAYRVRITADRRVLASIEVTYAVDFASQEPMTDPVFATFGEVNLPVNTWPYLREFLATTFGRMNWMPVTLPALKRGLDRTPRDGRDSTSSRGRRRIERPKQTT